MTAAPIILLPDRSTITLEDQIQAICDAVLANDRPVVLAVHGATGFSGHAASDRVGAARPPRSG